METIFTLTLRTLQQNKKRAFLTIFTIILSVGMMTAVLCGGWSMLRFLQEKEAVYGGDYAYRIELTSQQQAETLMQGKNIENVSLLRFAGSSFYGEPSNKNLLAIAEINDAFVENFYLEQYLLEGRYPFNENEIVLTQDFIDDNGLTFSVGDTIQLLLGTRVWDEIDTELYGLVNYLGDRESFHPDTAERTYTIVGIVSEMNGSKVASDFNAYIGISNNETNLSAFVKCKDISKSIYAEAEENAKAVGGIVSAFHSDLLIYHGVTAGKGAVKMIAAVAVVILLLMAACSAMISNVLSISLQERIKQLGMLASIGATSKQKKASVTIEAFLLGIIGIPLGLLFGLGLTVVVLAMIRISFKDTFTFGMIELKTYIYWLPFLLGAISGIGSLFLLVKLRENRFKSYSNRYIEANQHLSSKAKMDNAWKTNVNIFWNLRIVGFKKYPSESETLSCDNAFYFLAVVLGLSLYSFSDFMLFQTSMDMKEDGSSYTDVQAAVPYKDLATAAKAISDEGISADISYRISRYMTAAFEEENINSDMAGYFINGNFAELYVVGIDEEHFRAICKENDLNYTGYDGKPNHGILFNHATGNYGTSPNRVVVGSPFVLENGCKIELEYGDDTNKTVIVQDIVNGNNASIQSQFVQDRAVLIVPMSFFQWLLNDDTAIELTINTAQHEEVAECLADTGFFQVVDVASTTENSRQTYMLLKMMVCIFTVLMTMIIGLNVCNTISNTIDVRRSEFAVLRSVGMTSGGLKKMLLLESVLYGMKSLIFAIPISLIIHYVMYSMISKGMTPFVFYINWGAYGIAVIMVALVVVTAMLFSLRSIEKVEIVKELKTGSM